MSMVSNDLYEVLAGGGGGGFVKWLTKNRPGDWRLIEGTAKEPWTYFSALFYFLPKLSHYEGYSN